MINLLYFGGIIIGFLICATIAIIASLISKYSLGNGLRNLLMTGRVRFVFYIIPVLLAILTLVCVFLVASGKINNPWFALFILVLLAISNLPALLWASYMSDKYRRYVCPECVVSCTFKGYHAISIGLDRLLYECTFCEKVYQISDSTPPASSDSLSM